MRTRSSSNLVVESSTILKRRNRRRSKQIVEPELRTIIETHVATMADTRTMSKLIQAPTEEYGDMIVIPAILAENFELKVGLLQLVTSSQFHGFERDDPHAHICWFNKITSTLKYKNVPHDAIKLMLFPFSLKGATRIWLKKEPPRSILTWEDLVSKFVNYFFPPSKTTNLKNDNMNFQQKFDETFSEAWDRFKDLLRKCPHHGFSKLHQIDTFYNVLTQSDQDSQNAAAGGNLLNRTPRDALTIIENKSKVRTSRNKTIVSKVSTTTFSSPSPDVTALTEIVKELVLMNKDNQQAFVKAVEETCVTCGGPHLYYVCLATDSNTFNASAATGTYNQGEPIIEIQNNQIINMLTNLTMQKQSPSGLGSLPSNTVANPRGDVKAITTQSGVAYDGPTIPPTPSPLPKEVERKTEATKSEVQTTSSQIDYDVDPRVPLILESPFLRTTRALIDVHGEELILRDGDKQLIFHTDTSSKYPNEHRTESVKMINFIVISCEYNFEEVLKIKKLSHHLSGSTTSTPDSSPSLTPVETSNSLLEEFADELALLDPIPPGIGDVDFDPEGDIRLLFDEEFETFSNPIFDANDDFTSSDDESPPEADVLEENFKMYLNPLFEFDEEYISSDVNPLFNEVLEDIESKDSYVSNLDEPDLLVTPLFDANEDECFDPRGDIYEIDAFLDFDAF
ncbi:reverse transcriptase domain-containing protein [Tanacetum coccineum]